MPKVKSTVPKRFSEANLGLPNETDSVRVIQGDAVEVSRRLPSEMFDAVVTDPPYSSGGRTFGERSQSVSSKYVQSGSKRFADSDFAGDNRDQRSWRYWCHLWLSECVRLSKPGGYLLVFTDWRQLPTLTDVIQAAGWLWRGIIAWDKGGSSRAPNTRYFRHQCEYVVWATRGRFPPKGDWPAPGEGCFPGMYSYPVLQADKHHLTGKPTPLMRDLIRCVPPGGLVLDPFAGIGTTGIAAKQGGRRCVLIEQESEYCDVARQRLRQGA